MEAYTAGEAGLLAALEPAVGLVVRVSATDAHSDVESAAVSAVDPLFQTASAFEIVLHLVLSLIDVFPFSGPESLTGYELAAVKPEDGSGFSWFRN
jgi:hypothetical protein